MCYAARMRTQKHGILLLSLTSLLAGAAAQSPVQAHLHDPGGYYLGASALPLSPLILPAPTPDSQVTRDDLAELHRLAASRTPAQVKAAQADDGEEDMFVYRTVLGPSFEKAYLPVTAAFQAHVLTEAVAASGTLKNSFLRARPYQIDATLHPVCPEITAHTSYPSGHSIVGYLMALTLTEMVPERQVDLLARADDYAHNRMICGVHYKSDTVASKAASYAVFGELMRTPRFTEDLKTARQELRAKLKLNALPN